MPATGNLPTLWQDAIPLAEVPAYPTYIRKIAQGGEETFGWDAERLHHYLCEAEPGELLRDKDLRYIANFDENLAFRTLVRMRGDRDAVFQKVEKMLCKSSLLYFVNTYCWTYDPRINDVDKTIPFVTYPFQDDVLTWFVWLLKMGQEGLVEKSREMGLSWLLIALTSWLVNFYPGTTVYMSSMREADVDDRTMSSMFGKLRHIQKNLPEWMRGGWIEEGRGDKMLNMTIPEANSNVAGQKTESTSGRQGRATLIIPDEFAHISDAASALEDMASIAPCRIYNSTPKGMDNEFARMAHDPATVKKTIHWSLHPLKTLEWYAKEKAKPSNNDETMAQEHEIQYEKSTTGRVYPQFISSPAPEVPWCHIQEGSYFEYDPAYTVDTAQDYGMSDPTSILFIQIKPAPVEFHDRTKFMVLFFDEIERGDLTVLEWRWLLQEKNYVYGEHIGDMRTGNQRDSAGNTWITNFSAEQKEAIWSKALGVNIYGVEPVFIRGQYNDEFRPINTVRELLNTPGAMAFSRHGVPNSIRSMQNWGFPVDKQTRKVIPGSKPLHTPPSHSCKAMCYYLDFKFGKTKPMSRNAEMPWHFKTHQQARL